MSSDNLLPEITEGITKGTLDWSLEKINLFLQQLNDKQLAFIEEKRTIELVKEQYKAEEIVRKAINIVDAHSPSFFVIAGLKSAVKTLQESVEQIKFALKDYKVEVFSSGEKEIVFFRKQY